MASLNSAGSQYKHVLSGKEIDGLIERGTDYVIKEATKARSIQGQYKTAKYAQIGANIREVKARYEKGQAAQKESLKAREDKAEMEKFQAAKAARPAAANIRKKIKRIESGYALPQKSGPSLSAAQSKSSSTPKAPKTPLINKQQQELNETYD